MIATTGMTSKKAPPSLQIKRREGKWQIHPTFYRPLVGTLTIMALIEVFTRLGPIDQTFLPPLSTLFRQAALLLVDPNFLGHLGATLGIWLLGLVITILVAVPLGIFFGLWERIYDATRIIVEFVRPLPPVALIPLALLALGQGAEMKLAILVFAAMWPILFNTMYGVHGVHPQVREMAVAFGQSPSEVIRRVIVPSAFPFIMAGIRVAASLGLIVLITVEMLAGAANGLGAYIGQMQAVGNEIPKVYSGALVAGLCGLGVNAGLGKIESKWFNWESRMEAGR